MTQLPMSPMLLTSCPGRPSTVAGLGYLLNAKNISIADVEGTRGMSPIACTHILVHGCMCVCVYVCVGW